MAAFDAALVAHLPALRRYAIALVGNVARAEDLVHDCIERALRRADTLQDREKMAAWLRSILHNVHLDGLRRRDPAADVDYAEMADDLALSVAPDDGALAADLMRAMATLSVDHRRILLLVGLEGLSYREIADELHMQIGTVMSRLARARERLRAAMDGEFSPVVVSIARAKGTER
jgi:RNA polymerase sigma-70 factor (ECF subfamily)